MTTIKTGHADQQNQPQPPRPGGRTDTPQGADVRQRYLGRHRRCRQDIWCGGARCLLAVQHTGPCARSHVHQWTYRPTLSGWTVVRCACGAKDIV